MPSERHEPIKISILNIGIRYTNWIIRSFSCKDTEWLAECIRVRRFLHIERIAQRKLAQLDAVASLVFLQSPPGNQLESLRGGRKGCFSIRVNNQWRICFRYVDGDAYDVEIVDYHQ